VIETISVLLFLGAIHFVALTGKRSEEGDYSEEYSLKPVTDVIAASLGKPVPLIKDWVNGGFGVAEGELVLIENCRFNKGDK
jgi:phosphoglycerate kinase